jgi:tetratricopeptide (TPR) repeat protein
MNYRPLFLAGLLLLAGGLAAGIYHSIFSRGRLPVLSLTDVVESHFDETEELLRAGEFQKALERAQLAQRLLSRDRHVTLNNIGRAYLGLNDPQRAIEALEASIRLGPDYLPAHNELGIAHMAAGNHERAAAAFREALRIDPHSTAARENLERVLETLYPAAPTPATALDSPELERGRRYARLFHDGELNELSGNFSTAFADKMPPQALVALREQVIRDLGAESRLIDERVVRIRDRNLYVRRAKHERQPVPVELLISMTDAGAIEGIVLQPAAVDGSARR